MKVVLNMEGKPMTKRVSAVLMVLLLSLTGCMLWDTNPPAPSPTLTLLEEDAGWVEVSVLDVSSPGYFLHWGDVDTVYGESEVTVGQDDYEHFYQNPAQYTISLTDSEDTVVADVEVTVSAVDCHVSLVSVEDREILVRYFGRIGVDYSVSWGDGYAHQVTVETGTGLATHTYGAAGTYYVGMAEIWAPMRTHVSVTIE